MSNTYGIPEEDEKEVRTRDKHLLRVFSVPDHLRLPDITKRRVPPIAMICYKTELGKIVRPE